MKTVSALTAAAVALLITVPGSISGLASAAPTSDPSTVTTPTTIAPTTTTTVAPTTTTTTTTTTLAPTTSVEEIDEPAPPEPTTTIAGPVTTVPGSGDPDPEDVLPETGPRSTAAWYALGFVALGAAAVALSRRRFSVD